MLQTMTVRATIAAILAGLSLSAHAIADSPKTVHIPAGDLRQALLEIAEQFGTDLVYSPEQVRDLKTGGAHGQFTTEQAVIKLLEGTSLELRTDPSGAMLIAPPAPASKAAPQASTHSGRPNSFWQRLRLAQSETPSASQADTQNIEDSAQRQTIVELEEIAVTGSRIRGAQTAAPVQTYDREDFSEAGAATVPQFMRTLTQNFTGGVTEVGAALFNTRNGNDANLSFGSGINLRGLGSESTLVLLNGRRMTLGGLGSYTDISAVPLSAIERVDVMPDGASAIYGSDAVGGVVNFVLRDDFTGAETMARHGRTPDGGLRQTSVSQLMGVQWSGGGVLANLDYGESEPLTAHDRRYATGLQNGTNYLTPSDERVGVLISGHHDLSPDFTLELQSYANRRQARSAAYSTFAGRQQRYTAETEQFGATLELDWHISGDWSATLAHTYTSGGSDRTNIGDATPVAPGFRTEVNADHEASATELEAEGVLFELPGGMVRIALGAEYRIEDFGVDRVSLGTLPNALSREVAGTYAEINAPLIGAGNRTAWAHALSLTGAFRYEDYSDAGDADTYKFGALWSPVEGLNLRATYGTSFRAASLWQLDDSMSYGGIYGEPYFAVPLVFAIYSAAPDLEPETADTYTAGFDLDQDFLGVRLSATYFDIRYRDRILAAPFQDDILTNPLFAPVVSMPPDPEILAAALAAALFDNPFGLDLSDAVATFDGRVRNQGEFNVQGLDLTVERAFEWNKGTLTLGFNGSKYFTFETSLIRGSPLISTLDTTYNPVDLRVRAHGTWNAGHWSTAAFVNYVDDYTDNQIPGAPARVNSWTTLDLSVSYRFDEASALRGLSIRTSVNNVLDEEPPQIYEYGGSWGNAGFDVENADPIGRMISVELLKRW